jgi:hypothetical protein
LTAAGGISADAPIEPLEDGCGLEHRRSLPVERPLAHRRTLVIHIEKTAISVRVLPSDRSKAGYAGLDPERVDIRPHLAALDGTLNGTKASRGGVNSPLRRPGTVAGDLGQLHRVGDLVDPVDFFFYQRNTSCGLIGENRDTLVVAGYRQVVTQFAAARCINLIALLLRSSWPASPPPSRSR